MIVMLLARSHGATAFNSNSMRGVSSKVGARLVRQMSATVDKTSVEVENETVKLPDMEEIVSLCKRRGIIFPSSEIYNGYAGFFDYGPLGAELKKNIKDAWWQNFVTRREDIVGLDSSIIHNPTTWKSSGRCQGKAKCFETKVMVSYNLFSLHDNSLFGLYRSFGWLLGPNGRL